MKDLTDLEKQQIRYLVRSPQWKSLERARDLYIEKVRATLGSKNSQWETLKCFLIAEGKIEGIKEFLNELIKQ